MAEDKPKFDEVVEWVRRDLCIIEGISHGLTQVHSDAAAKLRNVVQNIRTNIKTLGEVK